MSFSVYLLFDEMKVLKWNEFFWNEMKLLQMDFPHS